MKDFKCLFISWAPYCSRSDNIARHFNAKSYMVYYSIFGSNYFSVTFKYLTQLIKSIFLIIREKPDVVFIMNPPVFSCIPAWIYVRLTKNKGYITDSHTAAFRQLKWKRLFHLQKYFFRNAISNIVTNRYHGEIVHSWGADYSVIGDIPVEFGVTKVYKNMSEGFNIAIVNTFDPTEPIDRIMGAAEHLKDVKFYITGNLKKANKKILRYKPNNITFTDFLPDEEYAWLIEKSDVVMTQCTIDNTMQRGAYEAMACGTPIITSDWPILRETFYKGTVFVKNDVESIINGILEMKENYEKYKKDIKELKQERMSIWERNKAALMNKIEARMKGQCRDNMERAKR